MPEKTKLHITSLGRSLMHSRKKLGPRMKPCEMPALMKHSYKDFSSRISEK